MSDMAIHADGLGKRYRIGVRPTGYRTLRESIVQVASSQFRRASGAGGQPSPIVTNESIWALRDLSFEIKRGEVVGIIGRNGAGKSTLLKILSRITEPTEGYADIRGRVGSLLEVGTGFHPELTGRENIYLNGAILGMKRIEIQNAFDEIVAFAEIDKFIDTPAKHYSSGMYMRLAFAVAAHLDPEILLIDEVLAVGDASFQKKCLGKMGEVAKGGKTVLFVSHNIGALQHICDNGLLLDAGKLLGQGQMGEIISQYVALISSASSNSAMFPEDPSKSIQITRIEVSDESGQPVSTFSVGSTVYLHIQYHVHRAIVGGNLAIVVSRNGTEILGSFDTDMNTDYLDHRAPGVYKYKVHLPTSILKSGLYTVHADTGVINRGTIERHREAVSFRIEDFEEDTSFKGYAEHRAGVIRVPVVWERAN